MRTSFIFRDSRDARIARIARIRSRLDGFPTLALCGNAYDGAGLPDCVRGGEHSAERLREAVQSSARD